MGYAQPSATPRGLFDDLATASRDGTGGSLEGSLDLVIRQVRTQHEHEFVSAHAPVSPSYGECPDARTATPSRSGPKGPGNTTRAGLFPPIRTGPRHDEGHQAGVGIGVVPGSGRYL